MNVSLPTRIPQNDDSVAMLLAKTLGAPDRGTLLASATRTATTSSAAINAANAKALIIFLNVTAASGTGGLRPTIDFLDPVSGNWRGLVACFSAAVTATGTTPFAAGPGIGSGQGFAINSGGWVGVPMSSQLRITVSHLDASSYTYSLGYELQ